MKKIFNKQSIFGKLCTVFISLVVVLFIIGFSIYNWGIKLIRSEIVHGECVQNKNFSDSLNNEFKRIITLQYGLVDDWDLMRLSTPIDGYNEYEKSLMEIRVKNKINTIKTSSKFIKQIQTIVPAINKTIGNMTITNISDESKKLIEKYSNMETKQIIYYNDELLLISEYPELYYKRDIEPKFLIHSKISKKAIKNFIDEMSMYKDSHGFFFSESRNMLICDEDKQLASKIKNNIIKNSGQKVISHLKSIKDTYVSNVNVDGENYIVISTNTGIADIKLVRYISETIAFGGVSKYKVIMWVFTIVAILFVICFSKYVYELIHYPLKKLVNAFGCLQKADFSVSIKHNSEDEFKYIYESFNETAKKLHNLIEQVYKQKILVQKAKLKQLQAQINPHFLYNSFLTLSNRIEDGDNEFASEFCRQLGYFFMFITRNKSDNVALKYEVEHAVTYCNIQHARFYNRIKIDIEPLAKKYENITVPKIILQPILENAFEHTLENMEEGGYLKMSYEEQDNYLLINIEDNGTVLKQQQLEKMIDNLEDSQVEITGMINIHRRLKLAYSENCGLILSRSSYGGLKVSVKIPIDRM